MSECLFCKIIADDIPSDKVYEDDKILVFKDISPKTPIHLLMIPKQHIDSLAEVTEQDAEIMGYMMTKVPQVAKEAGLEGGFRTVINTGDDGGQEVYHIHIHILGGAGRMPFV
ncbi:histidine triad nucleotide-binding protein [Kangiella koreensis]|uniref:Histidine triad (HIT) protein n=1 Tax=Kangiella koreensis (strain DSM 16069 / JCM 12317 / KCTC 12182 / SW-125) TaxID=523791 RepID=C7R8A6_KANKD|nr:histidine triad nucleotide-binding protein [Kangiella koreensis]ACV27671.1 histidine triad (HIT) protein [Kangiella koreensis DSM 16069]